MTETPEIPESLYSAAYDYAHSYKGKFYMCECSEVVFQNANFCPNCGQKLHIPKKIPNVRIRKRGVKK